MSDHSDIVVIVGASVAALAATILVINGAMKVYQATTAAVSAVQLLLNSNVVASTVAWIANAASVVASNVVLAILRTLTLANAAAMAVVRGATIAWTAVQWALNAALTANPIGLVIAAIALLVAGIVLAYKKSETFRDIVDSVFRFLKTVVVGYINIYIDTLKKVWEWLQKIIDMAKRVASAVADAFKINAPSWLSGLGGIFGRSATYSVPSGASTYSSTASTRGYSGAGQVNIYLQGTGYTIEDARVIKRALEGYDVGQGRRIGAPLAKSW
jgi:hypothetical protein